jgi:hypothetical protein
MRREYMMAVTGRDGASYNNFNLKQNLLNIIMLY